MTRPSPSPEEIQKTLDRVHYLYEERNKLAHLYYQLELGDLRRINRVIPFLDRADLTRLVELAETLASFAGFEPESDDVTGSG